MAIKTLAIKYRPTKWQDVVEQTAIKKILQRQLDTGSTKNAYLFCGGAGTGKTTSARIFANEINEHKGNPIEMDAASNNSVEDVRDIIQQAKTRSLDSEYKVFIIDECHSLSNTAWQAMLKLIEEPPAKSIFIFCTTDPQKIPKTILSRVQRYDFQRISQQGIVDRLSAILMAEYGAQCSEDSLEYIAKLAGGGMRDAITLLDKSLSYSTNLSLSNIIKALGTVDYDVMWKLTFAICDGDKKKLISIIEEVHQSGKDLKQFIKLLMNFLLDICKYECTRKFDYLQMPKTKENVDIFSEMFEEDYTKCRKLLDTVIRLNADIKWDTSPKAMIEAVLLLECQDESKNTVNF